MTGVSVRVLVRAVVATASFVAFFGAPGDALAAAGQLDAGFGSGGKVHVDLSISGSVPQQAEAVAVQSDGKITIVGYANETSGFPTYLGARFLANGAADVSMGAGGVVRADYVRGKAGLIQADGKYVGTGHVAAFNPTKVFIARGNPNGTVDATVGGGLGYLFGPDGSGEAVALQSDGKVVVAGHSAGGDFLVLRLTPANLAYDTTFGGTGTVITSLGAHPDGARSVAIQGDGKIVVAGTSSDGTDDRIAVVRYNPNGSLDTSFDGDGVVLTDLGPGPSVANAVLVQPDGKIVVAGSSQGAFALVRYEATGAIDGTFATDLSVSGAAEGIARQADGKLVAAGHHNGNFVVARFLSVGGLDPSFERGGAVTTDFGSAQDGAYAVAIQSNGRIVVAGGSATGITLARYSDDSCTTCACGNGVFDSDEYCDDGNLSSGDGCDADCSLSGCGNGIASGNEACDDGNEVNGDGCDNNCTETGCGNGIYTAGETCVDTTDPDLSWSNGLFGRGANDHAFAGVRVGFDFYLGGYLTSVDGTPTSQIARWNGLAWAPLGGGISNGDVWAIASYGSDVVVGGGFSSAGGVSVNNIARWNGNNWIGLGAGVDGEPVAFAKIGSDLYVGGSFSNAGGSPASNVAKWDGAAWSPLAGGTDEMVSALATDGTNLYAGGAFTSAGGQATNYVAMWDGAAWSALGTGTPDGVFALAVDGDDLWATGQDFVARWDGVSWTSYPVVGAGLTLAVAGGDIYLGGDFESVDGIAANRVARWDGVAWTPLGSGVDGEVNSLSVHGNELYVLGNFFQAGGRSARGAVIWRLPVCGNAIQESGEPCDDGPGKNGDGCDNNCTRTVCGNGIRTAGEACDDGNDIAGDGCENDCSYTPVVQVVGPGATVTSDPGGAGASPTFPVQTAITTPAEGSVSIAAPVGLPQPSGLVVVGTQLQLEAPSGSVAEPLVIVLTVDPSAIPAGVDPQDLDITRDGEVLAACAGPAGQAVPDPCVVRPFVETPGGDWSITVYTVHASLWSIGVSGLAKDEQKCVNAMNAAAVKVAKAQAKENASCLKDASKGAVSDAGACLTQDRKGKMAKVTAKTQVVATDKCSATPPFGFVPAATINAGAVAAELGVTDDVFGPDLELVVIDGADKVGAKCQASALKGVQKVFDAKAKRFLKCKKDGLSGKSELMVAALDIEGCFAVLAADEGGKLAKTVDKLAAVLGKSCAGVPLASALAGPCGPDPAPATCLDRRVDCRLCGFFNAADGLDHDCDAYDDGTLNDSCP